jgi:hypothetical protein
MSNKKYVYAFATLATLATLTVGTPVLAQTTTTTPRSAWGANNPGKGNMRANFKPGVFGTVTAISGNTITVTSKQRGPKTATGTAPTTVATVTYTVDATSATITKNNVAGNISSIVVGDTIMAQGTLTGTNLVATTIRDGQIGKGMHGQNGGTTGTSTSASQTPPITGNGQPVVAGTVTAVNGTSLTITNKSNVTYTIDATNAKIVEGQNTITVSSVAVGDMLVVQGTVSGNSVTASSVIDQKTATTTTGTTTQTKSKGFFGSIGSFFSHLFGF